MTWDKDDYYAAALIIILSVAGLLIGIYTLGFLTRTEGDAEINFDESPPEMKWGSPPEPEPGLTQENHTEIGVEAQP